MKQIGRNITDSIDGYLYNSRYLIMDGDAKFCEVFRDLVESSGVKPVRLPPRSPNPSPHIGRFHRSLKDECVNRMIFFTIRAIGEVHLLGGRCLPPLRAIPGQRRMDLVRCVVNLALHDVIGVVYEELMNDPRRGQRILDVLLEQVLASENGSERFRDDAIARDVATSDQHVDAVGRDRDQTSFGVEERRDLDDVVRRDPKVVCEDGSSPVDLGLRFGREASHEIIHFL